jgi:hypothetical protein
MIKFAITSMLDYQYDGSCGSTEANAAHYLDAVQWIGNNNFAAVSEYGYIFGMYELGFDATTNDAELATIFKLKYGDIIDKECNKVT